MTDEEFLKQYDDLVNDEEFIKHYGVLGMKWGIRKDRRRATRAAKEESRKGRVVVDIRSISDEDLRKMINRIQLEKQLIQLTTPERNKTTAFIQDILKDSVKSVAKVTITSAMKSAIEEAAKKKEKK